MNTKKLSLTAMLTGIAVVIFVIEMQIPLPITIPGIKLGLANVVTLFTLVVLGEKEAFFVLFMRIIICSIFAGGISSFIYSASGGVLCFIVMCAALKLLGNNLLWAISAFGSIAHNMGQLIAARIITANSAVFLYMPLLIISGIITGIFTGLCAYYVLKNKHIKRLTEIIE